ncbi:MAG: glucose-1-phosphate cytidylyltransferase [archaeon]
MKVVILCGGQGTRLREETEYKPKPMVTIGEMPILWHIMKIYSHYGFNEFVLCLGYKGDIIKRFFLDYEWMANDFTINLKNRMEWITHFRNDLEDWKITLAETGQDSLTAKRIKLAERYIDGDTFMMTYGDGVASMDIQKLLEFHRKMKKTATITGISPSSRFGALDVKDGLVKDFREKPLLKDVVNGGFMVLNKKVLKMIDEKDNYMFEDKTLPGLALKGELALYKHEGFWQSMDTYRDFQHLNKMWSANERPWKIWK